MRVRDVMTSEVVSVSPTASLKEAAQILSDRRISGLPVVDEGGAVVGVLSERDILFKERQRTVEKRGFLSRVHRARELDERKLDARAVGESMTAPAITTVGDEAVPIAAATMVDNDISRLPVLEDGRLVGIVTRADLVRAFNRSDEAIEREIRDDVFARTLFVSPSTVEIEVSGGEVTLRGWVETEPLTRMIPAMVQRVPGVVSVTSELGWRTPPGDDRESVHLKR